jgi:hypothetical protein
MSSPSEGIKFDFLKGFLNDATQQVKAKLEALSNVKSAVSIQAMFEMQMLMNHLSQLSEMSTGVLSAMNTSVSSMARNVKA